MSNKIVLILKGDSMVRYHIGPNRMDPDQSSCLNLFLDGSMGLQNKCLP